MRNPDAVDGCGDSSACAALLSYDDAFAILVGHALPLPDEIVPIERAGGRTLAAPIAARIDSPQRPVAAMDGYAIRSNDLDAGWRRFEVCGLTVAGDAEPDRIRKGQARRIMTGAPMPPGGDLVLPWETVTIEDGAIGFDGPILQRAHVRAAADDFARGAELLAAGTRLGPAALALAAAGNHGRIAVRPRPRIAIIAGGNELAAPGRVMSIDRCPDSLSLAITQLVADHEGVVVDCALLRDDPAAITLKASAVIATSDVLVMIGGAARGDRDFAKAGLAGLGLTIAFANVAMKPGKPVWYGRIGATHILGLPGNPLAALVTARLFLVPLIALLAGGDLSAATGWTDGRLATPIAAGNGRETFLCATITAAGINVVPQQPASGHLAMAAANALVRRSGDAPVAAVGDVVRFVPL